MEGFYSGARKIKTEYIKQANNFLERTEKKKFLRAGFEPAT